MQAIDFIVDPESTPSHSLACDRHLMHAVRRASRTRSGVLRIYSCPGDILALGRYHLAPEQGAKGRGVGVFRRLTGGRALPFGEGFVGLSLVLPHRSALLSSDPFTLSPHQVMNRYVRGILHGCKLVSLPAFYPGQDFVTVNGRTIAAVSFEIDAHGALLFEAIVANTRSFTLLPEFLEAVDHSGAVKAQILAPERTTCLARELGTRLTLSEIAEIFRKGYEEQFPLVLEPHTFSTLELQAIAGLAERQFRPESWLCERRQHAELDRYASAHVQLGVLEARYSLEQGRFLKEIEFSGDFIADSPGVLRLERELRLCSAEWQAINAVVQDVFSDPCHFILGIGPLRTIPDTVLRGMPS